MTMWHRILAVLVARNREFYRDRAGLGWNVVMPLVIVVALAAIFRAGPEPVFKVGVLGEGGAASLPLLTLEHVEQVAVSDPAAARAKVERHQLDLVVDLTSEPPGYWVNDDSPNGYLAERLLLGGQGDAPAEAGPALEVERRAVSGAAVRYIDWVLPGVLALNLMFSSLWGVGWVIVRYRKNGVLRRLSATPLRAAEFLVAQVLSRLLVVLGSTLVVYLGASVLIDVPMHGSYLALALVFACGALAMISLGLIVAARLRTEELADGVLNLLVWPMMLLSGVWFSLEGTSALAQAVAPLLPLTHVVDAARAVMIDGAGVVTVLPELGILLAFAAALLAIAARLFRWE